MKVSAFALVLTFLALGANSQNLLIQPDYIFDPVPVTEEGYWGDWSDTFSTYDKFLICGAEMRF